MSTRTMRATAPPRGMIAAGVALIGVCYGFARFAYGLFAPELQDEFTLTSTWSGAIGAGSYVGYCVAIGWSSVMTPRWGARRVAALAGAVAATGMVVVAVAPSAVVLAAGLLVAGSSTGIASPPLAAAISHRVGRSQQDRAQTLVNAGTGVGVLISGPVALVLLDSWRWAWGVYALGAALVTWWILATIPAEDRQDAPETRAPASRPHDVPLLGASFLLGLASIAVWTFGRALVTDGRTDGSVGTLAWTLIGAAGMVGALSGLLVQRIGIPRSWALLMLAMGAATAALAVGRTSITVVVVAAAVFGATYLALTGVALVWATRSQPDRPAFGVGAAFFMVAVGQAVGAPVAGVVGDLVGLPIAFFGCAAVAAVGAAVPLVTPGTSHDLPATAHG